MNTFNRIASEYCEHHVPTILLDEISNGHCTRGGHDGESTHRCSEKMCPFINGHNEKIEKCEVISLPS